MSCARKRSRNLYLAAIPVFTSKRLELLDIEKLKTEFRRLERRRGRSGKDAIDHPPRGSDDMANAVAGAIWLVSEHGGQFFVPEAYGERVSSKWNYLDGLSGHPATERFW